jgi:hypothetical protein
MIGGERRPLVSQLPDDPTDDGRRETFAERMDRNWDELVAELRVTQTGAQILVGFLLTVPFQQRFADLDGYQRMVYLVLVGLAVAATVLIVTPVSLHRLLFRRRLKRELVSAGNAFARAGLLVLALVLAGVPMLLFDVVVSRTAGWVAFAAVAAALVLCWWVAPRLVERRARAGDDTRAPGLPRPRGPATRPPET